jgi:hypothetical protein
MLALKSGQNNSNFLWKKAMEKILGSSHDGLFKDSFDFATLFQLVTC